MGSGVVTQGLHVLGDEAPTLFRSMEHIASQTEAGKFYVKFLKNKVEPLVGKTRQAYLQTGMPAAEAIKTATADVKKAAFGKNNLAMSGILQAVEKQGGRIAAEHIADAHNIYFAEEGLQGSAWRANAARTVRDSAGNVVKQGVGISPNTAYSGKTALENTLKTYSKLTQLSMISVPHAFQAPLNGLAVNGWKASFRTASDMMHDLPSAKAFAMKSGAISQELAYEMIASQKGTSKFSLLLDPMRKAFSMERRWGIVYSSVMGKHAALDAADTLFKSGGNDKAAAAQLKVLGQDVQKVMQQGGRLTTDDIERAAFRSSSEIMGFRSPLETPMAWEKNSAMRIGTTYKQYGFRAMRLHQQVLQRAYQTEGLIGVGKKALTNATVFPLAGEMIKGAEGAITGQNPWSAEKRKNNLMHSEYIDALATAMGFNLVYGAVRSSTYNKFASFAGGPILSTAADLTQDVINRNFGDPKKRAQAQRDFGKDVLGRAGLPGRILKPIVFPPKKSGTYQ